MSTGKKSKRTIVRSKRFAKAVLTHGRRLNRNTACLKNHFFDTEPVDAGDVACSYAAYSRV